MSPVAPAVLINGRRGGVLDASDRGLQFGDGVFETIAVRDGRPEFWTEHMERLREGLQRLGIAFQDPETLLSEAMTVARGTDGPGVLKIIVTRGPAGRGYAPSPEGRPTRVVALHPAPPDIGERRRRGVRVRWCRTRLATNPALAGIKHLNRLEQVLARAEWNDPDIAEGLMLDTSGRVIAATACNLFVARGGVLITPDLTDCGVAGIMRRVMMERAHANGLDVTVRDLAPGDVTSADEIFLTNSLVGVWPVARLEERQFGVGPLTRRATELVIHESD